MHKLTQCFIFCSLILISGCATNAYTQHIKPISTLKSSHTNIKSTRVVIGLDPNNSTNFIHQQHANSSQQYGLLGVLVESILVRSINEGRYEQAKLMSPIKSAAISFNFGSQFREQLEKNIKNVTWLKVTSVEKTPNFQRFNKKYLSQEKSNDSILVSDIFYKMEPDFSKITFTSYVVLYPNNNKLNEIARRSSPGSENPVLYQNRFTYSYNYGKNYKTPILAAKGWATDNGEMVRRALENGITHIAARIEKDLNLKL